LLISAFPVPPAPPPDAAMNIDISMAIVPGSVLPIPSIAAKGLYAALGVGGAIHGE